MTATAVITLSWSILHPASLFSPIIIHPTKERNSISSIGTVFWVKNVLFCHHPVLSDCDSVFWQLQLESLKLAGSRSSGKLSVCRSFHLSVFCSHRLQQKKKKKSKTKEIKPPPKKQNNWLRFNHRWILDVKLWFRFGVFAWEFCTCRTEIQLYWLFFTMCTVIIAGNYDLDFSNFCKQPGLSHLLCVPSIPSTTNILP